MARLFGIDHCADIAFNEFRKETALDQSCRISVFFRIWISTRFTARRVMNSCIVIINIFYLYHIYSSKEYFKILHIEGESDYLNYFLDYYKSDIDKFNPGYDITDPVISFFVLRDTVPAGVFICSDAGDGALNIELDFVTPRYRDFRVGSYIFEHEKEYFLTKGFNRLVCSYKNNAHIDYIKKMGFNKQIDNENIYVKKF